MSSQAPLSKNEGSSNLPAKSSNTPPTEDGEQARMGFMDHLMELRRRLWKAAVIIFIAMIVALVFYKELWGFMRAPVDDLNMSYRVPRLKADRLAKLFELPANTLTPEIMAAVNTVPKGPDGDPYLRVMREIFELKPDATKETVQSTISDNQSTRDENMRMLTTVHLLPTDDPLRIISPNPLSTMVIVMWLGIGAGLLLSSPFVFYELWAFVAPGLKKNEKNAIQPVLFGGVFFFLIGCAIAYKVLFPVSLQFFVWLDLWMEIQPLYSVEEYTSLLFNMLWITGLIWEIPLVVATFAKFGILSPRFLTRYWRICVLASFILGSIFSPGSDVMSMLVFSALLLGIYILSVLMAWFFYPKESARLDRIREAEQKKREEEDAEELRRSKK